VARYLPLEQVGEPNVRVAIPRLGESVAPCFGHCSIMAVFTVESGRVIDQIDFRLQSREPFDRVRLLRDQQVDTIICGGVQDVYEASLRANGIQVISWVSGSVDDLLALFVRGQLVPRTVNCRRSAHETTDHPKGSHIGGHKG
jgi:predicted Fe-Mo cluster-binding NifX family protein